MNLEANPDQVLDADQQTYPFKFTGKGDEYFRIWIVNLLLTIVTLSLYAPWAKVRRKRYFYGNTHLDGHTFDYHADPVKILKGRLLVIGFFIAYTVAIEFFPILGVILALGLFVLLPWAVVTSLRFNAFYSSYRGLRFGFTGTIGEAIAVYIGLPILVTFSFFIMLPYMWFRKSQYYVDGHQYGKKQFRLNATAGGYFKIGGWLLLLVVAGFAAVAGLGYAMKDSLNESNAGFFFLLLYAPILLAGVLYFVMTYNLTYGNSVIGEHSFNANMSIGKWVRLVAGNVFLVVLTLGLYLPWAQIRVARYKAQCTSLTGPSLNKFVGERVQEESAVGEQFAEVFDFDVGL